MLSGGCNLNNYKLNQIIHLKSFIIMKTNLLFLKTMALGVLVLMSVTAKAADFTTGNIVVALGDAGTAASAVSLLEYNTTTENQALPVQTINLNSTAGSTMFTTGVFAECQLQNSEDGYWLVTMGYNADAGSATATYKASNKSMIKIGKSGIPSYTELPQLVNNPTRSIATVDGSAYWMNPFGIYGYFSDQSAVVPATSITTGIMSVTGTVHRHLRIFKNKLYAMIGANIFYSDTELPTTAATATNSFFTLTVTQSGGFQFFDMDADVSTGWNGTGFDVIYVADAAQGLKKFYWDATLPTPAWVLKGTYANRPTAPKGYVGMAARMESGMPTFYVCQTSTSVVLANQLVKIVDSSMPDDAIMATSTVLATADATHSFRSVGFVPTAITASAPDAPTVDSITAGDAQLYISFTAPASDGGSPITNYRYSLDGGLTFPRAIAQTTSPLVITGLTNGTTYSVQIKAMNKFWDGPATASVSATPNIGTALAQFNANSFKVLAYNGGIQIQSADQQAYKIVNTVGQTIAKGRITSNNQFIPLIAKGIVLVQINNQLTKVLLAN